MGDGLVEGPTQPRAVAPADATQRRMSRRQRRIETGKPPPEQDRAWRIGGV
jgi:hypothetical protein